MSLKRNSCPIILIHKGDPNYIDYGIQCAKRSNPNSEIFLISDLRLSPKLNEIVTKIPLDDFGYAAGRICAAYVHMGQNRLEYERFRIERWYILKEFLCEHKFDHALYIDSDVLLFNDVNSFVKEGCSDDLIVADPNTASMSLWNNSGILNNFCEYILGFYEGTNPSLVDETNAWFAEHTSNDDSDIRITDEYFFSRFVQSFAKKRNIHTFCSGNNFIDHDINWHEANGEILIEPDMQNELKKIYWRQGIPFYKDLKTDQFIQMNSIHFKGPAKFYMPDYFNMSFMSSKMATDSMIAHQELILQLMK